MTVFNDLFFMPFLILFGLSCALLIFLLRGRKGLLEQGERLYALELKQNSLDQQLLQAEEKALALAEQLELTRQEHKATQARLDREVEQRHDAEKREHALQTRLSEYQQRSEVQVSEYKAVQEELASVRAEYQSLLERHSSLHAAQEERERSLKQQLAGFEDQKRLLEQSFQNLANRIFEEKGKSFSAHSKDSLEQMLKPFREQISEFRSRVDGIYKENNETTGSLRKELEHLRALNQSMTQDAKNLTDALKGDKKKVGSWGEIQLEKTLQLAGLVKGDHYETQALFKDQEGKNNYPDFIVRLPDDKHIILDSKVSLIDYDHAVSSEDEEHYQRAMEGHIQAVKNHIDGLAVKDYSNLIGMKSPSFVLMFMPIEPAYIEAMKHSKDLFNYGYQKNVILVSHTTLMPILRTVANLWMMERSNLEAREISDRAGEVFNQVCTVAERVQKLGATLQTASKHYNSAVVAIAGQQGLHGKVERFNRLSSKVTKSMPDMEPLHMDIENERLAALRVEAPSLKAEPEEAPDK